MITEILNMQDKMVLDDSIEECMREAICVALKEVANSTDYEVSVAIVDNVEIEKLNSRYRHIAAPTDVLSFPLDNDLDEMPLDMTPDEEVIVYDEMIEVDIDMEVGHICDTPEDMCSDEVEFVEVPMLGDIIISAEKAAEQAVEYGHSLTREMCYLSVHGVLHLLGYDHETEEDKKTMRELEEKVLLEIGLSR